MKNFKVFKSSAGSGKTFTLVKEYLKICLKAETSFAFANILAITFTNKATYEMKSRIMKGLKEISEEENEPLLSILEEETEIPRTEIKIRCSRLLSSILHNYADFSISTIDRFSHKVIRTFAKDLGLALNFKVQLEEKELLQSVIGLLIDSVGRDAAVNKLMLDFIDYRIEVEKSWRTEKDLVDFAYRLLQEKAMPHLEKLRELRIEDFEQQVKKYKRLNHQFLAELSLIGQKGVELIESNDLPIEAFSYGKNGVVSFYYQLKDGLLGKIQSKRVKDTVEQDKWYSAKTAVEYKDRIDSIKGELGELYFQAIEYAKVQLPSYTSRVEILKHIYHLSLLNEIEKRLNLLKKEEKLLNISDFNRLIHEVILSDPMPYIYERLGERYHHIMIDEFQDTSVLQYLNLLPLLEDSLAKGHENLIVGDAKQAIYRFRGGEVEQFTSMPSHPIEKLLGHEWNKDRVEALKNHYQEVVLSQNFRSQREVVNFNNSFFAFAKEQTLHNGLIGEIFDQHQQKALESKNGGYVEISLLEEKGEELLDKYQQEILQKVESCLEQGYRLSELAVVCRKRKQASQIANWLNEEGYKVISSEALLLLHSPKVTFLVAIAQYLNNPDLDLPRKQILEYLHESNRIKESLEVVFDLYLKNRQSWKVFFQENGWDLNEEQLLMSPLQECFEELIRMFQLNETYDVYLQFFQEAVLDFSQSKGGDLSAFLEWWEENQHQLALDLPQNMDAIQILTIHKSKGLEFPVVIYPFANQTVSHSNPMNQELIWVDLPAENESTVESALVSFTQGLKDSSLSQHYEEELRKKEVDLLNDTYVAFTRAAERLYILSESKEKSTHLSLSHLLHAYVGSSNMHTQENQYSVGKEERKEQQTIQPEEESKEVLQYRSTAWKDKVALSSLSVSKKGGKGTEARAYGTLVHEILANIHDHSEIEHTIEDFYFSGRLSEEQKTELLHKLQSLLKREEIKKFFSSEDPCKRESSLLSSEGELLRPDRVIYLKDQVAVMDYKTGEIADSHYDQLKHYCETIQQTTDQEVKGYLLYTELEELVEVE